MIEACAHHFACKKALTMGPDTRAHQSFVSPSQLHADLVISQAEYISDMTQVVKSIAALINSIR